MIRCIFIPSDYKHDPIMALAEFLDHDIVRLVVADGRQFDVMIPDHGIVVKLDREEDTKR